MQKYNVLKYSAGYICSWQELLSLSYRCVVVWLFDRFGGISLDLVMPLIVIDSKN